MFHDSKNDKVAYFGIWADGARDQALRREALRLCQSAQERCIDEDMRSCPDTQAALDWLSRNGHASAATRFRRAFQQPDPTERLAAVIFALSYLKRQMLAQGHHSV